MNLKAVQRRARGANYALVFVTPADRRRLLFLSIAVTALVLCFNSCGKRRPPLPPIEQVPQRTELLSGWQQGDQVILSWPTPSRNAAEGSVQSIRRIDIYRLTEPRLAPLGLTEEEFARQAAVIGSVDIEPTNTANQMLFYRDKVQLTDLPVRLRYAVRYVNAANQRASFSNFFLIEPVMRVSRPPSLLDPVPTESAITLNWKPPTANIDDSTPVNLYGYNIYRASKTQTRALPTRLNSAIVTANEFADQNFQFNEEYRYVVRAVSLGSEGARIESTDSNEVAILPRDTYPPSAPTKITIAPSTDRLSIFFPANPERDVIGYNLYRSINPDLPKSLWTKLNDKPEPRTTFHDLKVDRNTKYYYYLVAVDAAGNTSPPSEVVSNMVP